jgi:hypothetical protein
MGVEVWIDMVTFVTSQYLESFHSIWISHVRGLKIESLDKLEGTFNSKWSSRMWKTLFLLRLLIYAIGKIFKG